MVQQVVTKSELDAKLAEAGDKLVIIDFFATWCGPCKMVAPQIEKLSRERDDLVFLKVDVDESDELASEYQINAMPTFVLIKKNEKLESFSGANYDKLLALIEKHK